MQSHNEVWPVCLILQVKIFIKLPTKNMAWKLDSGPFLCSENHLLKSNLEKSVYTDFDLFLWFCCYIFYIISLFQKYYFPIMPKCLELVSRSHFL